MIKKFSKRQLMDQCGFTAEETQEILNYQKKLPVLVENDNVNGFCINARDLWVQLGKPQGKFSDWVKRKIISKKTKGGISTFAESKDYISFSQNCEKPLGGRPSQEYYITLDCAKNLSMMENTDSGSLCRQYFILMEKAVKKNTEWELIRYPLRKGYNNMKIALNSYMNRMIQKDADDWDYRIEADALNIIATGFPAKEIRLFVGCKDTITRDSLTATYNEYLMKLQEWNILFLGMNLNRYERYLKLKESFDIFYPNAIPIRDDIPVSKILENKQKLLEEVKSKVQRVA